VFKEIRELNSGADVLERIAYGVVVEGFAATPVD
jgi:hypothetical protein